MKTANFTELRSPRLLLRRLHADDAVAISGYRSLPNVARFQSWTTFDVDDATRLIADQAQLEPDTPGTWFQLAIVETASGLLIGDCGLHFRDDDTAQMEIGITLAPAHQGRGLASEALISALDFLFGTLGKYRVVATTDADNLAASALFRRLGFRQEAHFVEHVRFKGTYGSEYLFALLRREWQARPPRTAWSAR
ncbi:MAG: GNAT family protein [Rhodanobacteraceae bacterium]